MVSYHNTSKRSELNMAKQKLASDIRVAQNNSLGSKVWNGIATPPGGWGVHFDKNQPSQYIIFADTNNNRVYNGPQQEAVETKTLPAGITISAFSPADKFDVVFLPPDPVVYINGKAAGDSGSAIASVTLKENLNNSIGVVTVNFLGLIDTQ